MLKFWKIKISEVQNPQKSQSQKNKILNVEILEAEILKTWIPIGGKKAIYYKKGRKVNFGEGISKQWPI